MQVHAAIDFGISNSDVVAHADGKIHRWSRPYSSDPDDSSVRALLAAGNIELDVLPWLAVTGGRHRVLPDNLGRVDVVKINEVQAIGRGGQAALGLSIAERATAIMVASAGSGTALIRAEGDAYAHVSGTGVGGGTMLGLARLILDTLDPEEIEHLAEQGDRNGVDLSLADVITGPIGSLPADATAVNFGRLGRRAFDTAANRADLAAALVNLIAQTVALITINAARAHACTRVVMTGHMLDMAVFRTIVELVGVYYGATIDLAQHPGFATALGALVLAEERN